MHVRVTASFTSSFHSFYFSCTGGISQQSAVKRVARQTSVPDRWQSGRDETAVNRLLLCSWPHRWLQRISLHIRIAGCTSAARAPDFIGTVDVSSQGAVQHTVPTDEVDWLQRRWRVTWESHRFTPGERSTPKAANENVAPQEVPWLAILMRISAWHEVCEASARRRREVGI